MTLLRACLEHFIVVPEQFCHSFSSPKVDKKRVVSEEEGQRWAKDHGFLYFETSACSGANVGVAFSRLFEKALAGMKET